jgi:lipopolysaccharide assembly outer membrane protein LptD (OstA)
MPASLPIFWLTLLLLWAAPGAPRAEDLEAPFQVDADEVEYQADRDLYVARGNVVIQQQGRVLRADRVYFSQKTRQGVASGDVVIEDGDDVLRAPFLQFNIDDTRGLVLDGELDSPGGGYRMSGREVRKTGDQTYEFEDAHFTTCRCPKKESREPWAIEAKEAKLDLDGYGRARNSTLEILGIPVLWLPYAVYPLKRERQTGFLFPQFGTSNRSGGDIMIPFFWAVRDNVNVTLEPQYQMKRGFKPGVLVEYVYGEHAAGELYGTYINDQDIDPNGTSTPFGRDRWGTTWQHKQDLPFEGWMAADVAAVSDNQMPFDFSDFRQFRRDRFLDSTGWAGTHFSGGTSRFAMVASGQSADDLQNPDDQDRDDYLLNRLPALDADVMAGRVPGVPGMIVSSGVQFVNYQPFGDPSDDFDASLRVDDQFYDTGLDAIPTGEERNSAGLKVPTDEHRDDASPSRTGPERDGRFQEGEPLADHGQRFVAHPRVAYPMHIGDVLEVYPEAGYYGTFYNADRAGTDQRSLFTGRLDLRAKLRGDVDLPFMGPASHVAEPYLGWVGISKTDQDRNPLFVPGTAVPQQRLRTLELDNWTLDPADRIDEAANVVFGVGNRFWRQAGMLGEFDLYSEYQIAEGRWGPAILQGETVLPFGMYTRFHGVVDLDAGEFSDGLVDFGWSHRRGSRLSVGYRYVLDIPQVFENFERNDRFEDFSDNFSRINQINGAARWQMTEQWAMTYNGNYSFDNAISLINQFGLEYFSRCKCWAIRFEVNEDRTRGIDWTIRYRLVGLGDQRERTFAR